MMIIIIIHNDENDENANDEKDNVEENFLSLLISWL